MPANTSAAHQAGNRAHPVTRLVSVSGAMDPATPRDAGQQVAAGGFFWLDLEGLDAEAPSGTARASSSGAALPRWPAASRELPGPPGQLTRRGWRWPVVWRACSRPDRGSGD
jgi:hypothetical protein